MQPLNESSIRAISSRLNAAPFRLGESTVWLLSLVSHGLCVCASLFMTPNVPATCITGQVFQWRRPTTKHLLLHFTSTCLNKVMNSHLLTTRNCLCHHDITRCSSKTYPLRTWRQYKYSTRLRWRDLVLVQCTIATCCVIWINFVTSTARNFW